MTPGLTLLFAIAGGAAVGNLYWTQPLLGFISEDLGVSTAATGWLVTVTQLGYALGILLVVPLGDVLDRRKLVPAVLGTAVIALTASAVAPNFGVLLAANALIGLTTVSGQLLTPLAGDLADDATRGRIVGTVASGMLTAILLSRTISGLVADIAGWRAIFAIAAIAAAVFAIILRRRIPALPAKASIPYPALIASVFLAIRRERTVRWTLALAATGFATFTMFWTSLTFLLSTPPYSYPASIIGLFGLAGLAGVVAAQRAGRLHDRGWSLPTTGIAWALALASWITAALTGQWLIGVIAVVVVIDIAIQGLNLLNQTRLFSVDPTARSRLNTAFVCTNFLGGAIGSTLAGLLWSVGGWSAVTLTGTLLSLLGLAIWANGRRHALHIPDRSSYHPDPAERPTTS
ncbi:MFS transporter [Arthrobacter cavernae]|uniref:MFS transporter n=1 Tax=Arthrobacter cavernae TaxID=2817681 RepID=A0A939HE54_9MICC|nr:MFS transporter [Arthrobacter cavernae]MBO1269252.1 MFS transporter [Arthrobacter cavernae]